jgi:polyhydroxyalkanoate synthesis regulator phasin
MNMKLHSLVAATLTSTFLLGFGATAMADSTFDLVDALVKKGVLTEEEAIPLLKGREADISAEDKKIKKGRVGISEAIDNATVYGDIRARYEMRKGEDTAGFNEDRNRGRYKLTFGVKTNADDFYSDLAFAMGSGGRSDNATFAGSSGATNGGNAKETLFVKRAMLGWNATDWLSVEAGRIANPLYTTSMVWDGDLTFEGLAEKLNFKFDNVDVFANLVQSQYLGDYQDYSTGAGSNDRITNNILAFQGGAKFKITDDVSAKAAITFTKYTNDKATGARTFVPGLGTATGTGASLGTAVQGTNNLKTIEIPMEVAYQTSGNIGFKVFGDYVYNIDGNDRYKAAIAAAGANAAAIRNAGNDDNAWLLGLGVESKKDKKAQKDDWSAKLWYQDVGVYALDPNAVDSDFMDSRVNMKGVVFKAEYLLRDNVFLNFAAGHATRKNDDLAAVGTGGDIKLNLDTFDLYQFDMTYKF